MRSKQGKILGIAADISGRAVDTSAATAGIVMGVISTTLIAPAVVIVIALILHGAHY